MGPLEGVGSEWLWRQTNPGGFQWVGSTQPGGLREGGPTPDHPGR